MQSARITSHPSPHLKIRDSGTNMPSLLDAYDSTWGWSRSSLRAVKAMLLPGTMPDTSASPRPLTISAKICVLRTCW